MKCFWKKAIGIFLAASMTLGMMPSMAMADTDTNAAKIGDTEYATLQKAVDAASLAGGDIVLLKSVEEDVVIPADKDDTNPVAITLDLNGNMITNATKYTDITTGVDADHPVYLRTGEAAVTNYGTLEITDSSGDADDTKGSIYAAAACNIALLNMPGATLTFTKGECASATPNDISDKAEREGWYAVVNLGEMTIINGFFVKNFILPFQDGYATVINGYDRHLFANQTIPDDFEPAENAVMTINGGFFVSESDTIKNGDAYAEMTIHDGSFYAASLYDDTNTGAVLLNSNNCSLTVYGGTFKGYGAPPSLKCRNDAQTRMKGHLSGATVSGGKFLKSTDTTTDMTLSGDVIQTFVNDQTGSESIPAPILFVAGGDFYGLINTDIQDSDFDGTPVNATVNTDIVFFVGGYFSEKPTSDYVKNLEGRQYVVNEVSYTEDEYQYSYRVSEGIAGQTRYDTMSAIVKLQNVKTGGTVIVASGENYPDAICAAGLAGIENAPIILTDPDKLSTQAKDLLTSLAPSKIYIIGGESALSTSVRESVKAAAPNAPITSLAGNDRAATAVAIFRSADTWSKQCIITTGYEFADALSIGAYAYAAKCPVFLTKADGTLDDATAAAIKAGGFLSAVILGGTKAVSDTAITQSGIAATVRLGGDDRYQTSALIADWATGKSEDSVQPLVTLTYSFVCIASGQSFPDALAAASFAGKNQSVILLVSDTATGACTIDNNLKSSRYEVLADYILGGTGAVSQDMRDRIKAALTW